MIKKAQELLKQVWQFIKEFSKLLYEYALHISIGMYAREFKSQFIEYE